MNPSELFAQATEVLAMPDPLERALAEHASVVSIGSQNIPITVGGPTVGAYSDVGLLRAQSGVCICGEPIATTADGAVDATYSHVVTDILNVGGTAHGEPFDSTAYRYGLVALSHGACNSRHAVAHSLARRVGPTLRAALTYNG